MVTIAVSRGRIVNPSLSFVIIEERSTISIDPVGVIAVVILVSSALVHVYLVACDAA